MPLSHRKSAASPGAKAFRYEDRVRPVPDGAGNFDILIDGEKRFRLEGDRQWPQQWSLFPVVDGERAAQSVAIDNEYLDIVSRLQRGEHWLPASDVERVPQYTVRGATYTRWPEYLPSR
jgi:hypothetical protein